VALLGALGLIGLARTWVAPLLQDLPDWIAHLGAWGAVGFCGLYVLAVIALMPASWLTLAAGAVFGVPLGFVLVVLASNVGAAAAFLIARYLAREPLRRWLFRNPRLQAVDQAVNDGGWKLVALLRLSPAVPFNIQNYLYGLTSLRFWPCAFTSFVAMLPGTLFTWYWDMPCALVSRPRAAGLERPRNGPCWSWGWPPPCY
jgi:uncharacterized membrane protein YdjX (TVP38/TMEM64 family)